MSDQLFAAANEGDAHAQFVIGSLYTEGQSVEKDLREAARWWQKAADQGHPAAQYNLGYAHIHSYGVPVDPLAAYPMLREAARGYKRWEQEGVRTEGLDLRAARRDAKRMRPFVLPFYVVMSIQFFFASAGIGRFLMFRQATNGGNVAMVRRLIDTGMDVNAPARTFITPLIHACGVGATAVASLLFDRAADVNRRGEGIFNVPPIRVAAQSGEVSVVDLLLPHGADANAVATDDGSTALMVAAILGNEAILQSLIDAGADVNATNMQGLSALHFAAQEGHSECVALLLKAGADVNERSSSGVTALQIAESRRDKELVQLLRDRGAVG